MNSWKGHGSTAIALFSIASTMTEAYIAYGTLAKGSSAFERRNYPTLLRRIKC